MNWKTFWSACFLAVGIINCGIVSKLFFDDNDIYTNIAKFVFMIFAIFNLYQFLIRIK